MRHATIEELAAWLERAELEPLGQRRWPYLEPTDAMSGPQTSASSSRMTRCSVPSWSSSTARTPMGCPTQYRPDRATTTPDSNKPTVTTSCARSADADSSATHKPQTRSNGTSSNGSGHEPGRSQGPRSRHAEQRREPAALQRTTTDLVFNAFDLTGKNHAEQP